MRAAIAATTPWICANGKFKAKGTNCTLRINLLNNSISNSFLILEEEQTKRFCFIPLRADISASCIGNELFLNLSRYSSSTITIIIEDELQIELILSHIGKCSVLINLAPDNYFKENYAFLSAFFDQSESINMNTAEFQHEKGEDTILTPIVLSKTAKEIWMNWCLDNNKNFYTKLKPLKVSFLTWNVAGKHPVDETKEEFCRVFQGPVSASDVVVIAMEEIEMSVKSVVTGSSNYSEGWAEIIKQSPSILETNPDYVLATHDSVGTVFLAVLIKKSLLHFVKAGKPQQIKLGAGGLLANKAAILIPIEAGGATILAIGCHLTAHEPNFEERNQQIYEILEHNLCKKADYIFFVGDLNYRITLPYEVTINLCMNYDVNKLLQNDQLKQISQTNKIIGSLKEPEIKFLPTYKFDKNSDVYDTSSKRRVPSYTDRILFRTNKEKMIYISDNQDLVFETDSFKHFFQEHKEMFETECHSPLQQRTPKYPFDPHCIVYRSLRSKYSDHRPVHALFQVKVPVVDDDAFDEFNQILRAKYDELKNLSKPLISVEPSVIIYKKQNVQIQIHNKSFVWAHWFIKKIEGNLYVSPPSGRLIALQSTTLTCEFGPKFNVKSSYLIISLKNGDEIRINFTEEDNISNSPIELSVPSPGKLYQSLPVQEDHFTNLPSMNLTAPEGKVSGLLDNSPILLQPVYVQDLPILLKPEYDNDTDKPDNDSNENDDITSSTDTFTLLAPVADQD